MGFSVDPDFDCKSLDPSFGDLERWLLAAVFFFPDDVWSVCCFFGLNPNWAGPFLLQDFFTMFQKRDNGLCAEIIDITESILSWCLHWYCQSFKVVFLMRRLNEFQLKSRGFGEGHRSSLSFSLTSCIIHSLHTCWFELHLYPQLFRAETFPHSSFLGIFLVWIILFV